MRRFVAAALLVTGALAGWPGPSPAAEAPADTTTHLFYLHGAIVGRVGLPAVHPRFGEYAYDEILAALRAEGFTVHAGILAPTDDPWRHPRAIAARVDSLLAAGVPGRRIALVGGSLGGIRAAMVSHLVSDPDVRYVLLGACSDGVIRWWEDAGVALHGRVLAVYETSDAGHGSCGPAFARCADTLAAHHEIAVSTGREHGFLYRPLPEWFDPAVRWVRTGDP